MAYQPTSISHEDPKKPNYGPYYAAICTADHEMRSVNFQVNHPALIQTQGYNAWPSAKYRFHWPTEDYQKMDLGGAGAIVPVPGGGFLTLVVGPNESASGVDASGSRWQPTDIGLTRIDHRGRPLLVDTSEPAGMDPKTDADPTSDKYLKIRGVVKWLAVDPNAFISYPQLTYLGELEDGQHRFLLGWGVMRRRDETPSDVEKYKRMTVPWEYWVMEIDANGHEIQGTRRKIQGNGWGMNDEMVSHGRGQVAWVSTPDTTLRTSDEGMTPMCNPRQLQFNVYTSVSFERHN